MVNYDWAVNKVKLQQAEEAVIKDGREANEKNVKAEYVKRGGLLSEKAPVKRGNRRTAADPSDEEDEDVEVEADPKDEDAE